MAIVPPSLPPSPWTNQLLSLYHGTLDMHVPSILAGVNVHHGRAHTDFGQGFYTTTVKRQAQAWAWQLSQRIPGTLPAVIRFNIDRDHLERCSAYGLSAAVSMLTTSGASLPIAAPKEVITRGRQITVGMTSPSGESRHPGDGALPSEMRIR